MNIDKTTIVRFSIPAFLALSAAVFQSMAIREAIKTDSFVVLVNDMQPGDVIRPEDIKSEEISKRFTSRGVIPMKDSSIVVGSSVIRRLKANDLLLTNDLLIDRTTLAISAKETPIAFDIREGVIRSNNFFVGQMVHLLFYNEGQDVAFGDLTLGSKSDVEVGPLRIVSIGSAIAPYSESPDEMVRSIAIAVSNDDKFKTLILAAQDRDSPVELRGIYSRPKNK
jgi:hypothetical protein